MSSATTQDKPRDFVGAVVHVMEVLKAFDADHPKMTLSEVSKRTGLDRAGARRYLLSLAHLGYIKQEEKNFFLSPKVLELGYSYLATIPLSKVVQQYLDDITESTGETSAVAILDDTEVVHIARTNSPKMLAPVVTIGRRFPAIGTSSGRVLLAFMSDDDLRKALQAIGSDTIEAWNEKYSVDLVSILEKVRKQGYAIVDSEIEEGVRSLAVPIFNNDGKLVAAMNILTTIASTPSKRLTGELLPKLQQTSDTIQRLLVS